MGILQNYKEGNMDTLHTISYAETGVQSPYVTKDINNPPSSQGIPLQVNKRIDDTSRIAQMLVDKPGLKHLGNEALLKQSETLRKLQKKDFKKEDILPQIINTGKWVGQVAASTLAQVPVNGTGTHFLRGFRTDTYLQDGSERSGFAQFFGAGGVEGAPLALQGSPIEGTIESEFGKPTEDGFTINKSSNLQYDKILREQEPNKPVKPTPNIISAQTGNPIYVGSFQTVQVPTPLGPIIPVDIPTNRETTARKGELGASNKDLDIGSFVLPSDSSSDVQDFRDPDNPNQSSKGVLTGLDRQVKSYSFDYKNPNINIEQRVGIGNPGKVTRNRTSYTVDDQDTRDTVNHLNVSTNSLDENPDTKDLIQLEFQVITPEQTYYLAFRAFLDKFDDSFNATWNSQKYLGRAEDFYTYQGFDRTIGIGFKIAAQTREEMKPLYRKAATLASVVAPTYGDGGTFMRGSLAKVTVGDYIYQQPGIIESVQYNWQTNYPWEIALKQQEGDNPKDQVLPHVLDVTVSFKVIHDFLPTTGIVPFITNHRPRQEGKETYVPLN